MKKMTLVPAYGRDYKSKAAVLADFDADKDFLVADFSSPWDGKPVNKSQLVGDKFTDANIRYAGLRKVAVVKL